MAEGDGNEERVEMKGILDFEAIGKGISSGLGANAGFFSKIFSQLTEPTEPEATTAEPDPPADSPDKQPPSPSDDA